MAPPARTKTKTILQQWTALSVVFVVVSGQGGQFYGNQDPGNVQQPSPGDINYKTFVYNSRRYGQSVPQDYYPRQPQQNINPNNYNPEINRGLPPGVAEDPDRFRYQDVSKYVTKCYYCFM